MMMPWSTLLLMLSACLLINRIDASEDQDIQSPILISAWNLDRFGKAKMGKPDVVDIIVQVIRRHDIMVVLEAQDASGDSQDDLLEALNYGITDECDIYEMIRSERLGSPAEQFVYFWKPARVALISTYQVPDPQNVIKFEPFIAIFEGYFKNGHLNFSIIPIHTNTSDAVKEIDRLVDVYEAFSATTNVQDVLMIGDFNSGCDYVSTEDYDNIRLRNDNRFTWLISDRTGSTFSAKNCPYDRIVVAGPKIRDFIYSKSAQPFYYDELFGITHQELVEDVSDRYPVQIMLEGDVDEEVTAAISSTGTAITVTFAASPMEMANMTNFCFEDGLDLRVFTWSTESIDKALESLEAYSIQSSVNNLAKAVAVIAYKVKRGVLQDNSLYGDDTSSDTFTITSLCYNQKGSCTLMMSTSTDIN